METSKQAPGIDSSESIEQEPTTVLPCGHEVLEPDQIHYCSYIGMPLIEQLCNAFPGTIRERPASNPDEQQFIRIHQMVELAFEQLLFDLTRALNALTSDNPIVARRAIERMIAWMAQINSLLRLFSTMTREEFDAFRFSLVPASGAESLNARRFEVRSGVKEDQFYVNERGEGYVYRAFLDRKPCPGKLNPKTRWWTDELTALARQPTLRSAFTDALARQGETLETIHAPEKEGSPLRLIADLLHELDRTYLVFKSGHLRTTVEQIGDKPGTGHTSGALFLASSNKNLRLFPELWPFHQAAKE